MRQKRGLVFRGMSIFLIFLLLFGVNIRIKAASGGKKIPSRGIAIVFDNSGSMYMGDENEATAWCRAIYGMEVFASMMNEGDTLQIYPMGEIQISESHYDAGNPLTLRGGIDDPKVIEDIFTESPPGTPIETIQYAYQGLVNLTSEEKWLLVLTDGDEFYENDKPLPDTEARLTQDLGQCAAAVNVMYLGIGAGSALPDAVTNGTNRFEVMQAATSADVLSCLTTMTNMIFGRDELSAPDFDGKTMTLDVPMNKLILFAQGDFEHGNQGNTVSLTDASGSAFQAAETHQPHYGTKGAGKYSPKTDTSLQGVILTYHDIPAGTYYVDAGLASSIAAYYEPNVDVMMRLVDVNGNVCDPASANPAGTYYLQYGLIDPDGNLIDTTKTQQLGQANYELHYSLGNEPQTVTAEQNGQVELNVSEGAVLSNAEISASYLSGYQVYRTGEDMGWPSFGIQFSDPIGDLSLQLSGGADLYQLSQLEDQAVYTVSLTRDGQPMTEEELERTVLNPQLDGGNATVRCERSADGFLLRIGYADLSEETDCGDYVLNVSASYTSESGESAESNSAQAEFAIEDDGYGLNLTIEGPGSITLSQIDDTKPIVIRLSKDGAPLTQSEMEALEFSADLEGIPFDLTIGTSCYELKLRSDEKLTTGTYTLTCNASTTDQIGRTITAEGNKKISLLRFPLWVYYLMALLLLALLIALILFFLNQKVLPKKIVVQGGSTIFRVGGKKVDDDAKCRFSGGGKKAGTLSVRSPDYLMNPMMSCSVSMRLKAESPRKVKSFKRKARVTSISADTYVKSLNIDGEAFVRDPKTDRLIVAGDPEAPVNFLISNNALCTISSKIPNGRGGNTTVTLVATLRFQ